MELPVFFSFSLSTKNFFPPPIKYYQLHSGYRIEANIFIFPFILSFGHILTVAKKHLRCQELELNLGPWNKMLHPTNSLHLV